MAYEVFASSKFNEILDIVCATKAAWVDVMGFGVGINDPETSTINDLVIPFCVFVHNFIYID